MCGAFQNKNRPSQIFNLENGILTVGRFIGFFRTVVFLCEFCLDKSGADGAFTHVASSGAEFSRSPRSRPARHAWTLVPRSPV